MGKYEGSWSGMRRYLEHDMLAPCLYGRVRYGCTAYVGMDGSRIFEICIDGRPVKHFSLETVNTWFLDNGYRPVPGLWAWGNTGTACGCCWTRCPVPAGRRTPMMSSAMR